MPNEKDIIISARYVTLPPGAPLSDAMRSMDDSGIDIVVAADANDRFVGVLVDSDIRRALLRNPDMGQPIEGIMTRDPLTFPAETQVEELRRLVTGITHPYVPLVDAKGRATHLLAVWALEHQVRSLPNAAVIMAGGRGQRLMPLTSAQPKPMMRVGDRPILETIVRQLASSGIARIYMSVNYLSDQITGHFADGGAWGVHIEYLEEDVPLGTAGALAALSGRESEPMVVMNGDVLTRLNVERLLSFHAEEGASATIAVRRQQFEIPFGVVEVANQRMVAIAEKPSTDHFVNAGVYVLEPDTLGLLSPGQRRDMPDLLMAIDEDKPGSVACFAMPEYWMDVGREDDLNMARADYAAVFNQDKAGGG